MEASQLIKETTYNYQLKGKTIEVKYLYETLNYRIFIDDNDNLYRLPDTVVQHFITECK